MKDVPESWISHTFVTGGSVARLACRCSSGVEDGCRFRRRSARLSLERRRRRWSRRSLGAARRSRLSLAAARRLRRASPAGVAAVRRARRSAVAARWSRAATQRRGADRGADATRPRASRRERRPIAAPTADADREHRGGQRRGHAVRGWGAERKTSRLSGVGVFVESSGFLGKPKHGPESRGFRTLSIKYANVDRIYRDMLCSAHSTLSTACQFNLETEPLFNESNPPSLRRPHGGWRARGRGACGRFRDEHDHDQRRHRLLPARAAARRRSTSRRTRKRSGSRSPRAARQVGINDVASGRVTIADVSRDPLPTDPSGSSSTRSPSTGSA